LGRGQLLGMVEGERYGYLVFLDSLGRDDKHRRMDALWLLRPIERHVELAIGLPLWPVYLAGLLVIVASQHGGAP
jgi:hypothetical protein